MGPGYGFSSHFSYRSEKYVGRDAFSYSQACQPRLHWFNLQLHSWGGIYASGDNQWHYHYSAYREETRMNLTLLTILLLASVTYFTRIAGYALLRGKTVNLKVAQILESAPGCVLITILTPHFVTTNPAGLIALIIAILVAISFSLLPVVIISIASSVMLRHML